MKTLMMGGAVAALLMGSAANASTSSTKYSGHELAKQATITLDEARAAALKARPGRIVDQELEREGGGSGLRYSFDVVSKGKTIEVGIDAMTGNVLENGAESATKENKEKAEEAKVKH
jgi:uncharacterized membrane protein YkoI